MGLKRFQSCDYCVLHFVLGHVSSFYQNTFISLATEGLEHLLIITCDYGNGGTVLAGNPESQQTGGRNIDHI
jgi:hypothetical protein